ncbi:hypothetical protein [Ornithinibacillus bavariensis]|uniref:hypothetical protein n=1 Tax=Ornithinibacillus bavariensis TaxID=545502 RepID=UPI000EC758C7|nr:hypothetical protein [Ornithinibacillus sp.]
MPVIEKSPDQAIHDALFAISLQLGYSTYNYLPGKESTYPFVFIGEVFEQSRSTKSHLFGDYQVTIHIYADDPQRDRKTVSTMQNNIKNAFYQLKHTNGYQIIPKRHNGQIMLDNSTGVTFIHGILELDMTIN